MNDTPSKHRQGLFLLGLTLALGLVVSSYIGARSIVRVKLANQTVRVKGFAERRITSDWAVWRGSFSARAAALVDAYGTLKADLDRVLAFLEQTGVEKEQVELSSVEITVNYRKTEKGVATSEVEGYVLEQSIEVSAADVPLVARLSRESASLIKEGVEFRARAPEYFYMRLDELKIDMLGEATRDARRRAEQIATNSGAKVGAVRSATQGVFQITPVYSTRVSDYGINDTSSIEKSIKAVVTVEYSVR